MYLPGCKKKSYASLYVNGLCQVTAIISFRNGRNNTCVTTETVVGFADMHRKNFILCLNMHVANIVDFPGFIFTRSKKKRILEQKILS